jgi:hypothetical protein
MPPKDAAVPPKIPRSCCRDRPGEAVAAHPLLDSGGADHTIAFY